MGHSASALKPQGGHRRAEQQCDHHEQAKEVIDDALEIQEYAVLYFTAIVVENELGNTDAVDSFKKALDEQGVEMSDRIDDYLAGKMTALQLFTEGTGEVE